MILHHTEADCKAADQPPVPDTELLGGEMQGGEAEGHPELLKCDHVPSVPGEASALITSGGAEPSRPGAGLTVDTRHPGPGGEQLGAEVGRHGEGGDVKKDEEERHCQGAALVPSLYESSLGTAHYCTDDDHG